LYTAVVPHFGHLSRYIWAIFSFASCPSFIIHSIPHYTQFVKGLLSKFNFVRVMVAAHISLWKPPNSTAECPTRPAHSTAHNKIKLRIRENVRRTNINDTTYRIILWEFG
jgi:hypothetical protein